MSNELMKVTATEAMALGKTFFDSGMFADIKSAGMAVVKIMAGAEIGIPPFAAMSGIHIIQGKPTIGAGLMAATVKGSGKYDYKVIESTETNCSIDFYQGKEKIGNSSFSLKDAQKAQTKNLDKYPKNMLFARAISNGVKWFCPDVFAGPVYTPEEMEQVTEDVKPLSVTTEPPAATAKKTITTAGFDKLMAKLLTPDANIDQIVKDTMDKLELTEAQSELFVAKVAELQGEKLPV